MILLSYCHGGDINILTINGLSYKQRKFFCHIPAICCQSVQSADLTDKIAGQKDVGFKG